MFFEKTRKVTGSRKFPGQGKAFPYYLVPKLKDVFVKSCRVCLGFEIDGNVIGLAPPSLLESGVHFYSCAVPESGPENDQD
jgi:hypothetical protein